MKYLTPELLGQCRSDDDDVADAAAMEWERALASYAKRLKAIHLRLPRAVRRLRSRFSLHDARILAIGFGGKEPRMTLLLRLEDTPSQPGGVLELGYLLVAGRHGGVTFKKHQQLSSGASSREWVLYDEFDLDEERAFFTHSLLLADGSEMVVRFQNLELRRFGDVLISPLELTEEERTWPLVEA